MANQAVQRLCGCRNLAVWMAAGIMLLTTAAQAKGPVVRSQKTGYRKARSLREVIKNPHEGLWMTVGQVRKEFPKSTAYGEWRLAVSTAGTRGTIDTQDICRDTQISAGLVALFSRGFASYFKETAKNEGVRRRAPVIGDERYHGKQMRELETRILTAHGIETLRDVDDSGRHNIASATPLGSFVARDQRAAGAMNDTASHNPANQNGIKTACFTGGVDTDPMTDRQAEIITGLPNDKRVYFAPIDRKTQLNSRVKPLNFKEIYYDQYVRRVFPKPVIRRMKKAMEENNAKAIFDGLHGVGGYTMRYYLDRMFGKGENGFNWENYLTLMNEHPDSNFGGKVPEGLAGDPSDPLTLEWTGVLDALAADPEIIATTTGDMDYDRIGPCIRIEDKQIPLAAKFGLRVNREGKQKVPIVRFTPQQLFGLLSWNRLIDAFEQKLGTRDVKEIKQAIKEGKIDPKKFHVITTVATSEIVKSVGDFFGVSVHLTGIGFKYLGDTARKIDRRSLERKRKDPRAEEDVIISLQEESGGGILGPAPSELDIQKYGYSIARDKDTAILSLAIFDMAAQAKRQGRSVVDQYVAMAERLGGLFYFGREDCYLPNIKDAQSTDPKVMAKGEKIKGAVMDKALGLIDNEQDVVKLVRKGMEASGYQDPGTAVANREHSFDGTSVMQKVDGNWVNRPIQGRQIKLKDGTTVLVGRLIEAAGQGLVLRVLDAKGATIAGTLVRRSGTESIVRHYMEKKEAFGNPRPANLALMFAPMMRYLGLHQYDFTDPMTHERMPYDQHFAQVVHNNYVMPLEGARAQ